MDYNFNLSNPFAEPAPFNLEAPQGVPPQMAPQGGPANSSLLDALRALGINQGGGDPTEMWRAMMQMWAQQMEAQREQRAQEIAQTPRPQEFVEARRYYKDPYRAAQSAADAQRASDYANISNYKAMNAANAALGPGLSAAQIGMQGPSAVNQWAQLGAYKDFGIDPSEVARMTVNRRFPS